MMKRIAAAVTAVAAFCSAGVAAPTSEEVNAHIRLIEAIEASGVSVSFNEKDKCYSPNRAERIAGFYSGYYEHLAVCQDNATSWNGEIVQATDNDLDTIRHEAHHLVQDCSDGRIDGELVRFFDEDSAFMAEMPARRKAWVRRVYSEAGASEDVIELEFEAFHVARHVSADTITSAVTRLCQL